MHAPDLEALRPIVDQPDFDQAIQNDTDGSYRRAVETYLNEWKARVEGIRNSGLVPDEFEAMTRFAHALESSTKVVQFVQLINDLEGKNDGPA